MTLKQFNLHNFLEQTKLRVMTKNEIQQHDTNKYLLIDNIISVNNIYWCFYQEKSLKSDKIIEFIKSCNRIAILNNIYCIGIYLTKKNINSRYNTMIEIENNKYNIFNSKTFFIIINDINEDILLYKLRNTLYLNNIFVYDNDGNCIIGNTLSQSDKDSCNTLSQSDKDIEKSNAFHNTQLPAIMDSCNTLLQSDKDSCNTLLQSDKDLCNTLSQSDKDSCNTLLQSDKDSCNTLSQSDKDIEKSNAFHNTLLPAIMDSSNTCRKVTKIQVIPYINTRF